ncbi:hypothetical protein RJ639_013053 [Escallonia herrerae]|uniref:Uncharacterized protein n=1 Tax=Escallonia herrerae TaxID=1293975 RepID=A0AA88VIS1_9ASTE|nr:hypothetical protein RJ639_013053 [Escallonia herrerae]
MAATAYCFHGSNFDPSHILPMCVSPKEVILVSDVQQQKNCHLPCGLRHCDLVDETQAPYAVGLTKMFNLLEFKWKRMLCRESASEEV